MPIWVSGVDASGVLECEECGREFNHGDTICYVKESARLVDKTTEMVHSNRIFICEHCALPYFPVKKLPAEISKHPCQSCGSRLTTSCDN